jgi:osmotically-inducible protein OsmY
VLRELRFDPRVEASRIGVSATADGVVTLSGTVDQYVQKVAAEQAAKRVYGVRALANDIQVAIPSANVHSDTEIAEWAVIALRDRSTPLNGVKVTVQNGWVTLEGEVDSFYQKREAELAMAALAGVRGVSNHIRIRPSEVKMKQDQVKQQIEEALIRSARLDASGITVEISDGRAVLRGTVRSWAEKDEAENAAWNIPGIQQVEDRLQVAP